MGSSGPTTDVTRADVRSLFTRFDHPSTPISVAEAAEMLECDRHAAQSSLEELVERGELQTREVGDTGRVWWQSGDRNSSDQQSERQEFSAFVSAVEDYAIFKLDPDGHVVTWNDGAERIKGYEREDILGEHFSAFYTDEDVEADVPKRNLETAAEEGRIEDEGWRIREDGTTFWANVTITAVRDDGGTLRGFTKVTRDMTERREYEQQLRLERDVVEQIFETAPVGVGVLDADGRFVRANPRMLDRHGIDESGLDGYRLSSVDVADADGNPIPLDEWPITRVVEIGETVYGFECQVDPPHGDRLWLSISAAPLENETHDATHGGQVVAVVEDITDRKLRERQLRRERDQTQQLLRTAPIAIAVHDADGEPVMANRRAQEALGLTEEEIIDEPDDADEWTIYDANGDPIPPDETPSARVLATGDPVLDEEISFEPPSGEPIVFRLNAAPVLDADGAIARIIIAGEDITTLKERERQLERRKSELETELSEILGRISDAFYALDDEWRFTHLNDQAAEIMRRPRDELLGRSIWEAFPDAEPVYREYLETSMDTQEPVTFEVYGEGIESWLEFSAYPSETGLSIYFRDVTERKERERTLAKYETIVETVNDGIYVKDEDGYFTMVNRAYAELTGYDREELVGSHASLVVDEATIDRAKRAKETTLDAEGASPSLEATIQRADGGSVPAEGTFATIETGDGEYQQVGVVRDISNRKEYERKLEESERRYRTLVEHFPNGAVALVDEELRYQTVGGSPIDVANVTVDEVMGSPVAEIVPRGLAEELLPRYEAAFEGEASSFEAGSNGRIYEFRIVPVRDDAGDVFAALGMSQDVTERLEYERKIEESERRYRTLVEHFPNGAVGLFNEKLEYTVVGGRILESLDVEGENRIGRSIRDIHSTSLLEEIEPYFKAALEGESNGFEIEYGGRHLHAQTLPVRNVDDETFAGMLVVQDVTEQKERERQLEVLVERLEESNERLEQFAYAASHDLQEPLRMVSSYLQLLEKRYRDSLDDDAREFIGFAIDGAERMSEMIEGLLAYSRVETQGDSFEPVDLESVLSDVRTDLKLQISENDAEITAESLPRVEGDRGQIRQVFQNLLDNAIEYSGEEPPRVRIAADRDGARWRISVRDEGIGIEPDEQERIFEIFQRLHGRSEHTGTGIGLALCQRIVERHGGQLRVESALGEGATFYFTLPAADER